MSNACLRARHHLGVDYKRWVLKRSEHTTGAGAGRSQRFHRRLPTFTPADFFLRGNIYICIDRERTGYVTE